MSDYPMLISNKLHSFRNFSVQNNKKLFILYVVIQQIVINLQPILSFLSIEEHFYKLN